MLPNTNFKLILEVFCEKSQSVALKQDRSL